MQLRLVPFIAATTCFLALEPGVPARAASPVGLTKAEKQFKRSCGTCHSVGTAAERQGPNLATVIGRSAGSLSEFTKYSDALKTAGVGGLVWTPETLDPWIANASKYVPNTNMSYRQRNAEKRALVIDYLASMHKHADTNQ